MHRITYSIIPMRAFYFFEVLNFILYYPFSPISKYIYDARTEYQKAHVSNADINSTGGIINQNISLKRSSLEIYRILLRQLVGST